MKIAQFVHTLSYGDAISCEVLSLHNKFIEMKYESIVYTINTHPKYKHITKSYKEFPLDFDGEMILHYSLGSPLNVIYKNTKCKKNLIYHNITPSKWFKNVNPRVENDIELGISELPELCQISDRIISDSKFNAKDIKKLGFDSIVLDLPVDTNRWDEEASNQGILNLLRKDNSLHLLHVGRIAPNKCIEDIIKIFYYLHHHINPQSRLWIVGIDTDTEVYSFGLKKLISNLCLDNYVKLTGGLTDGELKSFYQASSVYICMSEHEGFCLPVVEAMNFGLPVVSYNAGALSETVSTGGIIVNKKIHHLIAQLIQEVHTNFELKNKLQKNGYDRVKSLSINHFNENVVKLF